MQYSLQRRGLTPPDNYATLKTAKQVADYLKQAQQISKTAAGAP